MKIVLSADMNRLRNHVVEWMRALLGFIENVWRPGLGPAIDVVAALCLLNASL